MALEIQTPSTHPFESAVRAEAHKGFVGRQMFCKKCGCILDCKSSTDTTLFVNDIPKSQIITCNRCTKGLDPHAAAAVIREQIVTDSTVEVEQYNGATGKYLRWTVEKQPTQSVAGKKFEQLTLEGTK
jgi:hypothetical protein